MSVSFWIIVDADKEIIYTSKEETFSEEEVINILLNKVDLNNDMDTVKYGNEYWSYKIEVNNNEFKIAFINSTRDFSILTTLAITFVIVITTAAGFILMFSTFFAEKAIKPIKESFEKQKRFISDASHELKTPLTVITSNIDLVLSNGKKTIKSQEKWLGFVKQETKRMTKLTNDLLILSKSDEEKNVEFKKEFDLSSLIETTSLPYEALAFDKKIKFNHTIIKDINYIGNANKLKQVIINLIDNAIKYNVENGSIEIVFEKLNNQTVLTIINTTDNISESELKNLCERFYRIDKSRNRKTGGHGLGLSIVKSILENHNSSLSFSKEDDKIKTTVVFK